jgi:signal transduction histidine kinase/CheY-like chemotaxis protein
VIADVSTLNREPGPPARSDVPTQPLAAPDERGSRAADRSAGLTSSSADRLFGADVFMALPTPTALLAPSGIVTAVNMAWRGLTGDDAAGDVGRPVWRRFAPAERSHLVALVERLRDATDGTPIVAGTQIRRTDGRTIDVALRVGTTHGGGPAVLLAQLEPLAGQAHDNVRRPGTGDRQVALATIARSVSVSTTIAGISESVIAAVAHATGCPLVALWRRADRHDGFLFVDGLGFGPGARGSLVLEGHAGGLAAHTIRSRSVVVIGGPTGTAAQMPRVLIERGVSSGVAVPLYGFAGGDGLLTVSATHNQPMDPEDVRFLAIVGDLLTMALHREGVDDLIAGERRRTDAVAHDLEQLQRRYRLATEIAGLRDWCWTRPRAVTTDRRVEPPPRWSVQTCLDGGPQAIVDCAVAEDADEVARAINTALADGDDLDITGRLRTSDGVVALHLRGTIERDEFLDVRQISGLATVATPPDSTPATDRYADRERLTRTTHDLNNLLAAVLGTAEQLTERGADRQQLTAIVHAGRRARELVAGLCGEHHDEHPLAGAYELADVVEQLRPLLHGLVGHDVRLLFQLRHDARALRPSREEVERILLDLVSNSADAVTAGGTVIVATDTCIQYERVADPNAPPAGRWARLRVCDNGAGMTPAAREQVFAPGFTTKPQRHHSGLGLAAVHETVTAAGGAISIASTPGGGTVIDVYLPLATQQAVRLQPLRPAALPRGSAGAAAPTSRIALIADDEPALRELLSGLLSRLGFEVTVAADGAAALALAREFDRLDLVVSDVRMPHLDGLELGRRVRALHARVAIVLLSGAPPATPAADRNVAARETRAGASGPEDMRILRKPFEWSDLRDTVLSLVGGDSDPAAQLEAPSPAASG